ncbi:DsbA family protein [Candidatus Acetothermia bacterium]|nr:DsbA family protein [Candidatus Acetothermia bacterium]
MANPKKKKIQRGQEQKSAKIAENQRIQKLTTYTGGAIVGVLILGILAYTFIIGPPPPFVADIHLEGQPVIGDPASKVKVVEFADFKCPSCKEFHDEAFKQLGADYIQTNKIAFYFMNFPIQSQTGLDTIAASNAGECVYQIDNAAFWKYYDALYTNQQDETQLWATPDNLIKIITDNNILPAEDLQQVTDCINNKSYSSEVDNDIQEGKNAHVYGTPTIFINGKKMKSPSYIDLKHEIDAQIEAAAAPPSGS